MYLKMARRIIRETDKRLLWKFLYNFGFKGMRSVQKFKARLKRGEYFPPFLYISIINSCNLRCQGCWVDVSAKQQTLDRQSLGRLITEAKAMGNSLFGILGGEPFMHPDLLAILGDHPDCYFQIFTNGHFVTDEVAAELRRLGNVTPLVSIEGSEIVSDERRGRNGVFERTLAGLENCLRHKLITGVSTSVCRNNFADLVSEAWVDRLIDMGVLYVWYYTYRPVGPEPRPELALARDQQRRIRQFVVDIRATKPIAVVDAYYDHNGKGLCPAVTGISHHISPWGDIEPCPIIQFAAESIHDGRPLRELFGRSAFLREFRERTATATRGCIVLERPDLLEEMIERHGARDTTVRQTALAELAAMHARQSQYDPDFAIPERSLVYRLAKRFWFNDFGAYDRLARTQKQPSFAAEPEAAAPL